MGGKHGTIEERLVRKIDRREDGCWLWTGYINVDGYGQMREGRVHRVAYALWVGPLPAGIPIDHICRIRNCVNPKHLRLSTFEENGRQGMETRWGKNRTHCHKGHPYRRRRGKAYCPQCQAEYDRRRTR